MKTVHPVQSVLPSEPRPPARIGIDSSAPILSNSDSDGMVSPEVEDMTEWQAGRLSHILRRLANQKLVENELDSAYA
jgi:hypothetical protein